MSGLTICIIIQSVMLLLSVSYFVIVGRRRLSDITKYLLIIGFFVMAHNFGYLLELMSTSRIQGITAIRAEYFGGAFVGTYLTLFIVKHCGYRYPKWLQTIVFLFDALIVVAVLTSDYHTLFYRSVDYSDEGMIPHMVLERGPLFYVYTMTLLSQFTANVYLLVRTLMRTRYSRLKASCRNLLIPTMIPPIAFALGTLLPWKEFDLVPASVAIASFWYGMVVLRGEIFDGFDIAYASLIRNLREPVVIIDNEYHFMEANESALETFPYLRKRAIGEMLEHLEDWEKEEKSGEIVREGRCYAYYKNEITDGSVLLGYSLLFFDLTEERSKLEEMRRLKSDADLANQAKTEFLARMSHEIRTPINAILGMNEVIRRESKDNNISRYAQDIENSAETLLGIINDILDNTKIESGKLEIIPYEYRLADTFQYIYNMNLLKAQEKDLDFVMEIDPRLPSKLFGDDLRIRQVVMNLLSNAIKYTAQGSVRVRVKGLIAEDRIRLHYEVEDTGIGIKEEDMPKLFASFERIEESRNRNIQGTGLGMTISKHLLELMDSKLDVQSEYGKGTRFAFDVVQKVVDFEPMGIFQPDRLETARSEYHAKFYAPDAKVLVVDDNAMNRGVFRNLLKQTAIQIDDADSGMACLGMIEKNSYHIIFMDHMMPGMDGVETLAAMKALGDHPNRKTPVVMLTANAIAGAREEYLSQGFDDFLTKPINSTKLEAMIAYYLPKSLVTKEPPTSVKTEEELPKEAVMEPAMADLSKEADSLPQLDEFDWEYALGYVGTTEILLDTVDACYEAFEDLSKELGPMVEKIEEAGVVANYRIKVHSLKSSAATIGAQLLSKLARLLEVAAIEGNIEKIRTMNPILLEELTKHMERMATILPNTEEPLE